MSDTVRYQVFRTAFMRNPNSGKHYRFVIHFWYVQIRVNGTEDVILNSDQCNITENWSSLTLSDQKESFSSVLQCNCEN